MQAILLKKFGGLEELYLGGTDTPSISSKEVLVKVKATALNRADLLQRRGLYPPPPGESEILGLEMAGEVDTLGSEVSKWKKGDKVFALLPGGGYAEYVKVHEDMLMPIPENLSFEEAAGIAEAFLTAWQAVIWLGEIKEHEEILIHAGASGVGTAAIQIAKNLQTKVIVTASKGKHEICKNLGANHCIDYKSENFETVISEKRNPGVDFILDFIGAPYFQQNINSLRPDGRMVMLGLMGGLKMKEANLSPILFKRLKIMGSTLRARKLEYKIALTNDFKNKCLPLFTDKKIKPIIDSVFNWKDVKAAHQKMEENKNAGKIILRMKD